MSFPCPISVGIGTFLFVINMGLVFVQVSVGFGLEFDLLSKSIGFSGYEPHVSVFSWAMRQWFLF